MKQLLAIISLLLITTNAQAASTSLPIKAEIINLTLMPLEDAIAFCDERALECPLLRIKYEQAVSDNVNTAIPADAYKQIAQESLLVSAISIRYE